MVYRSGLGNAYGRKEVPGLEAPRERWEGDGCKGVTESGERRTVLEGVHRTNQTHQNKFYRVDLNNGVLRQDMGWSVEDERDTHTYIHPYIQGGKYAESYHNASVR